jgi:hypothetical protein
VRGELIKIRQTSVQINPQKLGHTTARQVWGFEEIIVRTLHQNSDLRSSPHQIDSDTYDIAQHLQHGRTQ